MKKILLGWILIFGLTLHMNAQVVYVNSAASGANDGTSWSNAYTSLVFALATNAEEIWIAKGTYKNTFPTSTNSSFVVNKETKIYGGFEGNETSIDQRNPVANVTILSGDNSGDDNPGDLTINKLDNSYHVIYVDSLVPSLLVDGVTISNGNTLDTVYLEEENWRGGGIFSYSKLTINNCIFKENNARSGGCIYITDRGPLTGDGSSFTNCQFFNNRSVSQSAGIYLSATNNVNIKSCVFRDNRTTRGALYPLRCSNLTVDSCSFTNNVGIASDGFGGAIFNWNSPNLVIKNTNFDGNIAGNGGAINNDGRELSFDVTNSRAGTSFINCNFTNNEAVDWGGGVLYNWQGPLYVEGCTFDKNVSPNSGSHIFSNQIGKKVEIINSSFKGGRCNFGGAHTSYGEGRYEIMNNTYEDSEVATSGGAIIVGFKANALVKDCNFTFNTANFGGAIYSQNDSTELTIDNCEFFGNTANNTGGAILKGGGSDMTISNSIFKSNNGSFGAAASFSNTFFRPALIQNSIFEGNTSSSQGGAINVFDAEVDVVSSVFNSNENTGLAGGAISNNAGDSTSSHILVMNSTFFGNTSTIGNAIGQYESDLSGEATITLQNSIFISDADNYGVEAGMPEVISNGGNISNDASMVSVLTASKDLNSESRDIFVDPFAGEFELVAGSPAISNGIATNAPDTDIAGNPRLWDIDAGAYEYITTNVEDKLDLLKLSIFPVPSRDYLSISLDENMVGEKHIEVIDNLGKQIYKLATFDNDITINTSEWSGGSYKLVVRSNHARRATKFVKL